MSKRVLKWSIAVDDSVGVVGGGKVVHVASQNPPYLIEVWTEEFGVEVPRRVQVFGYPVQGNLHGRSRFTYGQTKLPQTVVMSNEPGG